MKSFYIGMTKHMQYDSFEELRDIRPSNVNLHMWRSFIDHPQNPMDWFGAMTADEVRGWVRTGWPEGAAEARRMLATLNPTGKVDTTSAKKRRKRRRGDHGDSLDIHAVYQGRVDRAWERPVKDGDFVKAKGRAAHVVVNIGSNCNVPHMQAMWRTALTVFIVDRLIQQGRPCKVTVHFHGEYCFTGSRHFGMSCTVKNYHMPASIEKIAAMTSVGFLRVFGFAAGWSGVEEATPNFGYMRQGERTIPPHVKEDQERGVEIFHIQEELTEWSAQKFLRDRGLVE